MTTPTESQILARLDKLIAESDLREPVTGRFEFNLLGKWRAQALSLLRNSLGEDSAYAHDFAKAVDDVAPFYVAIDSAISMGVGVLQAARDDVANGYLAKTTILITAEVFNDFLDMAAHLLSNHYHYPAGALIGAVLEDGLRRIATADGVSFSFPGSINTLNQALVQTGVYSQLQWREIQVWGDLRNKIGHGQFDSDVTEDRVKDMHRGVSKFLAEYLR